MHYDKSASTELQYSLEKKSYLTLVIIKFSLIVKVLLLAFFTHTLDELSHIVPGAMCAAGVISANEYGETLMVVKIFFIIFALLWLTLNREDLHSKDFKHFKSKNYFFLFIYLFSLLEVLLELLFFTSLTTIEPVSCCSTLYQNSQASNSLIFNFSTPQLVLSFYALFVLIVLSALYQNRYTLALLSPLFAYISYHSLVYFFSSYVYELPTHKCPYCLLQAEYHYIGYFIYSSFIIAFYYSLCTLLFSFKKDSFKYAILFYSLFTFFTSICFIIYLILNKTFL